MSQITRRKFTLEQKKEMVEAIEKSAIEGKMTIHEAAGLHNLSVSVFYTWKKALKTKNTGPKKPVAQPKLIPLMTTEPVVTPPKDKLFIAFVGSVDQVLHAVKEMRAS